MDPARGPGPALAAGSSADAAATRAPDSPTCRLRHRPAASAIQWAWGRARALPELEPPPARGFTTELLVVGNRAWLAAAAGSNIGWIEYLRLMDQSQVRVVSRVLHWHAIQWAG